MALHRAASCLLALVFVAGCASTEMTNRQRYGGQPPLQPGRIIIHDLTADPADIPAYSGFATQVERAPPPTPEQAELGRKAGAEVTKDLVADLQGMGLPAVAAAGQPLPQAGHGGAAGVVAATANPIGLIVGGAIKATGDATGRDTIEGAAERTATEISGQLREAAQQQGWI